MKMMEDDINKLMVNLVEKQKVIFKKKFYMKK